MKITKEIAAGVGTAVLVLVVFAFAQFVSPLKIFIDGFARAIEALVVKYQEYDPGMSPFWIASIYVWIICIFVVYGLLRKRQRKFATAFLLSSIILGLFAAYFIPRDQEAILRMENKRILKDQLQQIGL